VVTLARVLKVEVTGDTLSIDLEGGRSVSVPIGCYPRLENGKPAERANLQISFSLSIARVAGDESV
jgi:hypothetical protein